MFKKTALSLLVTSVITGCGGGPSGSESTQTTQPLQPNAPVVETAGFFTAVADKLPVFKDYLNSISNECNIVFPIVNLIDLNLDGKKDLVVHLSCILPSNLWGSVKTDAPNDALMVFLQQHDGKFVFSNEQVFGKKEVRIQGNTRKAVSADFNNDGYPDLAYAVNREDGRTGDGSVMAAQSVVMLSEGSGKYKVDALGTPDWFHSVDAIKNSEGYYDVIFAGFNGSVSQSFRNKDGKWMSLGNYYPDVSASTFRAISDGKTIITDMGNSHVGNSASIVKYSLDNQLWSKSDQYIVTGFLVPFVTYNTSLSQAFAVNVGNETHIGAGYEESCFLKLYPDTQVFIGKKNSEIVPSYTQGRNVTHNINNQIITLDAFKFQDKIEKLPSIFENEDKKASFNDIKCKDVNNDGYDDLVVSKFGNNEGVIVYLNNKQGKLVKLDPSNFPKSYTDNPYQSSSGIYEDVNGDGIPDLLVWSIDGSKTPLMYKGIKHPTLDNK
jgi:hypothetical protein